MRAITQDARSRVATDAIVAEVLAEERRIVLKSWGPS
jgi:hypothetical protein